MLTHLGLTRIARDLELWMLEARSKCFLWGDGRRRVISNLKRAALLSHPWVIDPTWTLWTIAVALTIS